MKNEQPENMTSFGFERMQRWAAFSVRAHRDQKSLATDLLLYDKLILPVPENEDELVRWEENHWDPDAIANTVVRGAGRILPVPWTAQLRAEFDENWKQMKKLGEEVAYGGTAWIYASSPEAWNEIQKSLQPGEEPSRKPSLLAGYQSAEEARVQLGLQSLNLKSSPEAKNPDLMPGGRPVDNLVAMQIRRLVHEPVFDDPKEAFEIAITLVQDPTFQQARQGLFDWEDRLFVDHWTTKEAQEKLLGLQEAYRDAVSKHKKAERLRWVSTLLPKAAGWVTTAAGHPHLSSGVSYGTKWIAGKFLSIPDQPGLDRHAGAALEMIRFAYREQEPLSDAEALRLVEVLP